MPTIKVSDKIYKELVSMAGSLQKEHGRIVTVSEALEVFFKKIQWKNNELKIDEEMKEAK